MLKAAIRILLISMFLFPSSVSAQGQIVWYVATTGSDSVGDGSIGHPFHTIQHAIGAANDGDTVIVMEGKYTGLGNVNLNYTGKAVTVRSRDPDNQACVRATVIDAEGQGVIVRFINDEGLKSVFAGFSLVAGDTSAAVRGIPGFFEFSDNARPTTRSLRVVGDGPFLATDQISSAEASLLYEERIWDGNNPFHQPATTTDYYGSGDVDGDGTLTAMDASLAQEMADGLAPPSSRADVDGNSMVNADDVLRINNALTGGALPGWWNSLVGRTERNAWASTIMAIDQTDKHPWINSWFVCSRFAEQTFIHSTFYRGDLHFTRFDGGQTQFNVPMYYVNVLGPSYGHGINAILVGDDPLNFDDWRFLEPQTDYDVYPGMWDMPYGTNVHIIAPGKFYVNETTASTKVVFYVDETGWALQDYNPDLILVRPIPETDPPDNRPDLWNPRIVPVDQGMILFERTREDMSRMTDVHIAALPLIDPPAGSPLTLSSQYSRLLDVFLAPDGTIHLLWTGKPEYTPGVFHGELDPLTQEITGATRVSTGSRMVREGRVVVTSEGETHVFWLEEKKHSGHPYDTGIYWTRWMGSGWQTAQNLTPEIGLMLDLERPGWDNPDFLRYSFDVSVLGDGNIVLIWVEHPDWVGNDPVAAVQQLRYDGEWGSSTIIDSTYDYYIHPLGVELATDFAGTLHLVYWTGGVWDSWGDLTHRMYDGSSWSAPAIIDASGNAGYPQMIAGAGDVVYLVWARKGSNHVIPIWNEYVDGQWQVEQELSIQPETDAWYPMADFLPDGSLAIAWSSLSPDRVAIEVAMIAFYPSHNLFLPLIMRETVGQ